MEFTYKELIEVAIGSPESGHVNFYALQVLLTCFAQRLEVLDQVVVQDDYMMTNMRLQRSLLNLSQSRKTRMFAGADAEEDVPTEAPAEDAAPLAEAEEAPPVDKAEEVAPVDKAEEAAPVDKAEEASLADEAPLVDNDAPLLSQAEEVTAEEIVKTEPNEAASKLELKPAASRHSQEEVLTSQPEPEPSQGSHEAEEKCAIVSAVASQASHVSAYDKQYLISLNARLTQMELSKENGDLEMKHFVANLTGQVKIIVKQLDTVAHMMIDSKHDPARIKVLRRFAKELRVLMRATDEEISIRSSTNEDMEAEEDLGLLEEAVQEESSASTELDRVEKVDKEPEYGMKFLCYTPSRMLMELLDSKANFCALTNQVNELSAAFLKQDSQRIMGMINELQGTMRETRIFMSSTTESIGNMITRIKVLENEAEVQKKATTHLDILKADMSEMEILLSEKPNFHQLAAKVSLEKLEEFSEMLENKFCEIRNIIIINEKNVLQIIDNLRMTMGIDALELSYKDFRELIERKVHLIADALNKYMELTNDDCAAAVGKVKVMRDLGCLSCDTECVMRTMELSKVPPLPTARGSTGLGPVITYEVGQIRKSGVHSTSAWAKGVAKGPKCTQRNAGGKHTIHTAEGHLQKVLLSKKNTVFT